MTHAYAAPTHRWIWPVAVVVVTLLALGLRWYYVNTAMVINPIRGDATHYYAYAWNLFHHGVFAGNPPHSAVLVPSSFRDPGYPAFLALWMAAFHNHALWYGAVLLAQALLGALTVTFAMLLGRHWLGWRWATAAGVLMAVWPHNITIASDLLSETLLGFLVALAMLLCARACKRQSARWAVAAGLVFGLGALTSAVLIPFGILLALYLMLRRHLAWQVGVALLVAALVLPGAWAIRNSQLPVQASGHSSLDRAELNFVEGSWPVYHAAYQAMLKGDPQGRRALDRINAQSKLLRAHPRFGMQAIAHRFAQHPWHYVAWYTLQKPRDLWGWRIWLGQNDIYVYPAIHSPFDEEPVMRALESVCEIINPALAALMLLCLILTLVRRGPWRNAPDGQSMLEATLALLVYVTLVYSALQSAPRYSIPFRSFEMLMAMGACSALVGWLRQRVVASRKHASQVT